MAGQQIVFTVKKHGYRNVSFLVWDHSSDQFSSPDHVLLCKMMFKALPRSLPERCYSVSSVTLRTVVSPKKQQLLDTKSDLTKTLLIMARSPPDTAVSPTWVLQQFSSRLPFFSRDSYTARSCRNSSCHFSCLGTAAATADPAVTAPTVAPQRSLATILTNCSSSITILRPRLPMVLVVGTSMV